MRNKFEGKCYICGKKVEVGQGYFQRDKGRWLVKHRGCKAIKSSSLITKTT